MGQKQAGGISPYLGQVGQIVVAHYPQDPPRPAYNWSRPVVVARKMGRLRKAVMVLVLVAVALLAAVRVYVAVGTTYPDAAPAKTDNSI